MLQYRRTFEDEKHQLQELNGRLGQYLSRTKQLEQENACLITEINKIREEKTVEWEKQYMAEIRELRRMVGQLSFEKSRAEMEREKLWQEFQMVQNMCCEQTVVRKDIGGELKCCEKQLLQAQQTNGALEERLFQLDNEYKSLDDAHRQEIAHLRSQVHSRVVVTETYGHPAATMEEVQEYARSLSEGWIDTFEVYRLRVEEMEESIKADQAKLDDLQREKMHYASELERMRAEGEKQSQIQIDLEEQIMHMQENFHAELSQYQMIVDELEEERRLLADSMADKLREHQELLKVQMNLGAEVASYRALLEGERVTVNEAHMWANQHGRDRVIDIKISQPYTQRVSTSTRQDLRKHLDVRYMEPSVRRSPVPAQSGSRSPSRVIPISFTDRANQSPAARRDMVSFTKASQAAAAAAASSSVKTVPATDDKKIQASSSVKTVPATDDKKIQDMQKTAVGERSVRIKEVSQASVKEQFIPIASPTADTRSVTVVSPPMMSLGRSTREESDVKVREADVSSRDDNTDVAKKNEKQVERQERGRAFQSEQTVLDSVSMEEIIETVMKPAGLDAKISSSGDSKIMYHVEKTQQEDGTTKTQIILESKVEEELDMSEDAALEELLGKGVKTMSLEDIKGTPTGDMIQNLLSLGLAGGEDLGNKSVNVEIIEEPVEYEDDDEDEDKDEVKSKRSQPSSMFFQIEELENDPQGNKRYESQGEEMKTSMTTADHSGHRSVQVQEDSGNVDPYFTLDQDSQEYFVSTPDDNMSEPEDGGGIASYGHYGAVDDLSDERYYQEAGIQGKRMFGEESDSYRPASDTKYMEDEEHPYVRERESFPGCIIEEEVHVSPTVQESMLGFLREESLDPKEQLRGVLEQLQGTVSGTIREELDLLTRAGSDSPQNFDIRNVHQSTDNGTMTITAELNVSQTLGEPGEQGDDISEEEIMAALRASNPGFQQAFQGGAEGGYTLRVSRDQDTTGIGGFGGYIATGESVTEVTEKHVKLGPSEKSFTFQMDVNNSQAQAGDTTERSLFSQVTDPPLKVIHEKRIATVYLESSEDK